MYRSPVSVLSNLYAAGAETVHSGNAPGVITPAHAQAAIRRADQLAAAVHRDIKSSRVRAEFRAYWAEFYNNWLAFKTINGDALAQVDPQRVLEVDVPAFLRRLYEWRDALQTEGGAVTASAVVAGEAPASAARGPFKSEMGMRAMLVIGGLCVAGYFGKRWWDEREERRRQELETMMEAQREQAAALLSPAVANPAPAPQMAPIIVNIPPPVYTGKAA